MSGALSRTAARTASPSSRSSSSRDGRRRARAAGRAGACPAKPAPPVTNARPLRPGPRACALTRGGLQARARAATRRSRRSPRARPICASQPSSRLAFSTDGQRRCTSTSNDGRCSSSNAAGSSPHASQMMRAISATVSSSDGGDVEVLVLAGGVGHRGDDPVGDVVHVGERARLLARAEDLQRPLPGQHLADHVGDHVRDARLVVGHLARPVGVERAADRVGQPVLVVQGAAVDLAGELREAVGRVRRRAVAPGAPRWSGTPSRARTPSTTRRRRAARRAGRAPRGTRRCRGPLFTSSSVCGSLWKLAIPPTIAARWITCVQSLTAARASSASRRSPVCTSHDSRIQAGASRWSETRTSKPASPISRRTTARADRAGAAGYEDARPRLDGHARHGWRTLARRPSRSTGPRAARRRAAAPSRSSNAGVVGGDHDRLGARRARPRAARSRRARAGRGAPRAPARARAAGSSLNESESRRSSESRLKVRPSTATLRSRSEPPRRALEPLDEEQRHRLVHARDGQQHARRARALLGEGEVLAQAGARGQPGSAIPPRG